MVNSDFVRIGTFFNTLDAEHVKHVLEQQGVAAYIEGGHINTTLSHIGSALGGVRVLVQRLDVERAHEIVATLESEKDETAEDWHCGNCNETMGAAFESCWSCGRNRQDVERPLVADPQELATEAEGGEQLESLSQRTENPYASPQVSHGMLQRDKSVVVHDAAEEMILRAWRASIFGLFLLPIVMHLYSTYLLLRASAMTPGFSPNAQKRYYWAMTMNVLVCFVFYIWFQSLRS